MSNQIKTMNVGGSAYIGGAIKISGSRINTGQRTITTQNYVEGNISGGNIAGRDVLIKTGKDAGVKPLLEELLAVVKELNEKIPASQELIDLTSSAETLINESNRETPRRKWYELNLEGIKDAAIAIGKAAEPVLVLAEKLSPLLLGL